jgi:hypothetical protein
LRNESAYELSRRFGLSFHFRTRVLPSALYLAAALALLAVAKTMGH